ncbi:MAG: type II secretion system F family protein, partial [Methylococcaceae bacterium]
MFMRRLLTFNWEGFDHSGRFHQGEIVAQSEILARTELRQLGIRPRTLRRLSLLRRLKGEDRIRSHDIADFSRQLATLLSAGVPLLQALEVIGCGHEHPSMKNLLLGIKMQVEKGNSLADSLARYPHQFNALYCNLTRVGEQAGILDTLLIKIADNLEKSESLKKRMHNALT